MSPKLTICIEKEDKPANIPDYMTIIRKSFEELPRQSTATNISGVKLDLDQTSDGDVSSIWVKFGIQVAMSAAKTQDYVAHYLELHGITTVRTPRLYSAFTYGTEGFIVTEFIDGQICTDADTRLVTAAVQSLINIPSPSTTPGPYGGGLMEHPFFIERKSSVVYNSVKELEAHINGILRKTERPGNVDLTAEVEKFGLRLCVSDIVHANFIKEADGKIVAVDFAGYSFLPPSFFAFALHHGSSNFALRVARRLKYTQPELSQLNALRSASYALVPFGTNAIGLPKRRLRPASARRCSPDRILL